MRYDLKIANDKKDSETKTQIITRKENKQHS